MMTLCETDLREIMKAAATRFGLIADAATSDTAQDRAEKLETLCVRMLRGLDGNGTVTIVK